MSSWRIFSNDDRHIKFLFRCPHHCFLKVNTWRFYIGYKIVLFYFYLDYIIKFLKEIKSLKESENIWKENLHEKETRNPTTILINKNPKLKKTSNLNTTELLDPCRVDVSSLMMIDTPWSWSLIFASVLYFILPLIIFFFWNLVPYRLYSEKWIL